MRLKKILSVGRLEDREKAHELTKHISPEDRVSQLEDQRQQVAKVLGYEYPRRLRRILTVTQFGFPEDSLDPDLFRESGISFEWEYHQLE